MSGQHAAIMSASSAILCLASRLGIQGTNESTNQSDGVFNYDYVGAGSSSDDI